MMEVTEEQRRRAEANRLAALEKRKRAAELADSRPWKLSRCPSIPCPKPVEPRAPPVSPFRVVLEICSADEFSAAPEPIQGSWFPGEAECLRIIENCVLSVVPFQPTLSQSGRMISVFKLLDYDLVSRCIKKLAVVELQEIPYTTRLVVKKFSQSVGIQWTPCMEGHHSEEQVDELLVKLPKTLRDSLLPFQLEGVRFALQRGGRCLIADEMGLGKTIQAIAIACCFNDEGPILIVCPAVLRFSWAEEIEHWLPTLLPKDIHLVFGHQDNLDYLERHPKVVVISYTMLSRLRKAMLERNWSVIIVDESHNIRCTKKQFESEETKSVLELARKTKRIILLSGTPSLSRPYDIYHQINMLWPGLLGKDKYEFAKNYCSVKLVQGSQGTFFKDFSKGIRLGELNILLRQTVMVRRLKEHVLSQLPPKRRQIIWMVLKAADTLLAKATCRTSGTISMDGELREESSKDCCLDDDTYDGDQKSEKHYPCSGSQCKKSQKHLSRQVIGIAKLSGFREWFSNHFTFGESEDVDNLETERRSQKTIIFAHHLMVLDGIQAFISEKGIKFVRLDGNTLGRERKHAIDTFCFSDEVMIAIIGITVGSCGLNLSSAQNVIFLELPETSAEMIQAEDRAHRQGQKNAVNIYIFCAKGTTDESRWLRLNRSLFGCSTMANGKKYAIKEIEVGSVLQLGCKDSSIVSKAIPTGDPNGRLVVHNVHGHENSALHEQTNTHDVELENHSLNLGKHDIHNIEGRHREKYNSGFEGNSSEICKGDMEFDLLENSCDEEKKLVGMQHDTDGGVSQELIADETFNIKVEWLRFDVSQYTGRVHLYTCIPGKHSRPEPLFENFRLEELNSIMASSGDKCEATPENLIRNPAYWNVFKFFFEEWNNLRPIERNKLFGKPLQLPLIAELCYLKEGINHSSGGLLRGGSTRRVTPLSDICRPLPENSAWKKIILQRGAAKEREYTQAWTTNDVPLCKLCQQPCNGKFAKAPQYFEDLFCNLSCFHEYRIRTSQRALREALFRIEQGVCTNCKLDCHNLVRCIRPLSKAYRKEYIERVAPKLAQKKKLLDKLVHDPKEGNAWHADHIIPVFKGGGECQLENMRTLCVACHLEVTKAQQLERRMVRKMAKEQLKIIMKQLETAKFLTSGYDEDGKTQDAEERLFIKVPGSVYSIDDGISGNLENDISIGC
ncbi:DNA annealing helicase and endonuclease ZRANB3-like isoform X2 [Zingiber officinale]|uniref:DNA annealing helicase and endonuclease ZRANB3-like isoform X2 n=1 Tax=Zingiber officinale TaxID=94328 RepID=UPI001C4CE40A|nr:DNA annealing helicase and endonuclease ZRANB3-like isoform X2 [Zingiber officinale]